MAKICIVEDDIEDARNRYKELSGKYELDLVLITTDRMHPFNESDIDIYRQMMKLNKFEPENVFVGEKNMPLADIYFCDGLHGKCFGLADKLGRNKTFIYSSDFGINEKAKNDGYQLAGDLEEILRRLKK